MTLRTNSYLSRGASTVRWLELQVTAGGDFLEVVEFVGAVRRGRKPTIGIHEAMDMTLPGLISQRSIAEGGRSLDVPDSRDW